MDNTQELLVKAHADITRMVEEAKKTLSDFDDIRDGNINVRADELENATCEQSVTITEKIADVENAICELTELLTSE